MPLVPQTGASLMAAAVNAQNQRQADGLPLLSPAQMAAEIAAAYHEYAKGATVLGADMSAGGDVGILEDAFVATNDPAMAEQIAQGICDYWSSAGVVGLPAHGGTAVVSVAVAGGTVLAAMQAAIEGLVTDKPVAEPYLKFFQDTEAVVKTIPVTVVEMMPTTPPSPSPFPETIS